MEGAINLERDREGGKALREEPDHGVEAPHDDGQPGDLAVELNHLGVLHEVMRRHSVLARWDMEGWSTSKRLLHEGG